MISAVIRIFIETLSGNLERIGRHFLLAGLVLFLVIASLNHSKATHLRAGEIIVRRDNCSSLTFTITVIVYMDKESSVKFGEGTLRLGDGSDPDGDEKVGFKLPEIDPVYRPDLGGLITTASFTYQHTYGAPGRYIISYFEHNRNADILNIANSVSNPFFIEAEINIDPFLGCNNSPVMLIPPIDKACTGVAFFHNPGAYDPDGDSLSFELVIPKKDVGTPVDNYRNPTSPEFFVKSDYLNEDKTGPPEISIDPVTGLFKWDAPGDDENSQGREYNVAFIIKEWRKKGDTWFQMGYVVRDMQILVEDCDNERPELVVPNDTCVVAGTLIDEKIFGLDPDNHLVKIEAFSQVFHISNPASYYPADGRLQSTLAPTDTANVRFNWQTDCSHVRDQPYQVVFKITDYPELGPKLTNFETWNITVVAPPPQWVDAQLDFPNKGVNLTWDEYTCQNAESIQVWRRVDSYNYVAGDCETGMPDYLGYELVDEVYPDTFNYFDDNHGAGLNVGAAYCYRLVASFSPAVGGGIGTESIISDEICLEPVIADAPVVTHVTVDTTDVQNGAVTISWRPPFDLDQALFGTDYHYEIQRGEGLAAVDFIKVGQTADTTFHDRGFNTEYHSYSYRIILYSNDASVAGPTDPI
ncbi:MAG: gliding motility-associated C-terminal domain-containing protein, partial [Cyclobacteriaceae bacterium]|nr:gliding motility-associated C-terminal domain-containing protein [Cyclobacteriaceae bacterium]